MKYIGNQRNPIAGEDRRVYSVLEGNATTNQTLFSVNYEEGRVDAFLNGVKLTPTDDFTFTTSGIGSSITLVTGISSTDYLQLFGHIGLSGNQISSRNYIVGTSSGDYDGSTTVFPISNNVGDKVNVYLNGALLDRYSGDFSVSPTNGTITLATAASTGDSVELHRIGLIETAPDVFTGADGTNPGTTGLVPSPDPTDNVNYLKGDGTWSAVPTPDVFTGADGSNAGTTGLVPQPSADKNNKYLRGDGTWSTSSVEDESFINAIIFG